MDGTVACATCHQPEHHFASPEPIAIGVGGRTGKRNAPSIFNSGYGKFLFWDGRAASLEKQALLPITNPDELGSDIDVLIANLRQDADYVQEFTSVFSEHVGDSKQAADPELITPENLVRAIASFERSLLLAIRWSIVFAIPIMPHFRARPARGSGFSKAKVVAGSVIRVAT